MKTPFFSIVLPTYNRAHLISETIISVIEQSFTDWELIIVDDGSTDETENVVSKFFEARIRYLKQTNQERSAARNNGIDLAKGEFICFLDSDDRWRNNHLQVLFERIRINNKEAAFYFTAMTWNFPDKKKDVIFGSPEGKNLVEYVIANQIGTPTSCIHNTILKKHRFNINLRINEDVELFARIVAENRLIQIPISTVDVIVHNQNTKSLEKNYIIPQIRALKTIFSNPAFKNKISKDFKVSRFQNLRHQLINHYLKNQEYVKMNIQIICFLLSYPLHFQNKSKIVLLLYHLPGGNILKKIVRYLNPHK